MILMQATARGDGAAVAEGGVRRVQAPAEIHSIARVEEVGVLLYQPEAVQVLLSPQLRVTAAPVAQRRGVFGEPGVRLRTSRRSVGSAGVSLALEPPLQAE